MSLGSSLAQRCLPASTCSAVSIRWAPVPREASPWLCRVRGTELPRRSPRASFHLSHSHRRADGGQPAEPASTTAVWPTRDEPPPQQPAQESVLIEPFRKYPHKSETHRSKQRHHRSATAQLRHDLIRQAQRAAVPDWRAILRFLAVATPDQPAPRPTALLNKDTDARGEATAKEDGRRVSVRLVVDWREAYRFSRDLENSLWDLRHDVGCEVCVLRRRLDKARKDDDRSVQLIVSGPLAAVDEAIKYVQRAVKKLQVIRLDSTESGDNGEESESAGNGVSTLTGVQTTASPYSRLYNAPLAAKDLPKPAIWTKPSFAQYITSLIYSRLPTRLAAQVYPDGTTHETAVIAQLHRAFNDPHARPALSTAAYKTALAFLASKGSARGEDARALLAHMSLSGLPIDAEVLNMLAASAARIGDLQGFQAALRLMVQQYGLSPDGDTWRAFLHLVKDVGVRRLAMQVMAEKGLMQLPRQQQRRDQDDGSSSNAVRDTPGLVRHISTEVIGEDLERAIRSATASWDLHAFLAGRDAAYGRAWRSLGSANRMLEVLGRHGRLDDCAALLDAMAAPDWRAVPDAVSLNTLLTHCRVRNLARPAVLFVARLERLWAAAAEEAAEDEEGQEEGVVLAARQQQQQQQQRPDAIALHLLFILGYRNKLPHTTGVALRYALVADRSTWRVRNRATKLLRDRRLRARLTGWFVRGGEDAHATTRAEEEEEDLIRRILFGGFCEEGRQASGSHENSRGGLSARDVDGLSLLPLSAAAGGPIAAPLPTPFSSGDFAPARPLGELLAEAYEADMRLIRDVREDKPVVFEPLPFPLRRRTQKKGQGGNAGVVRRYLVA